MNTEGNLLFTDQQSQRHRNTTDLPLDTGRKSPNGDVELSNVLEEIKVPKTNVKGSLKHFKKINQDDVYIEHELKEASDLRRMKSSGE